MILLALPFRFRFAFAGAGRYNGGRMERAELLDLAERVLRLPTAVWQWFNG
jgi:hypothetical protein